MSEGESVDDAEGDERRALDERGGAGSQTTNDPSSQVALHNKLISLAYIQRRYPHRPPLREVSLSSFVIPLSTT